MTNADTIDMYAQARTGVFDDWESPLVSEIWFLLGAGPRVLAATTAAVIAGTALFGVLLARRSGLSFQDSCIVTILTLLTPPVLGGITYNAKDSWVAVLFLSGIYFACLNRQYPQLVYAFSMIRTFIYAVACLIRPEFILVALLFAALEFFFAGRDKQGSPGQVFALDLISLVVFIFLMKTVVWKIGEPKKLYPEQYLYLCDLIYIAHCTGHSDIPAEFTVGKDLTDNIMHNYNPEEVQGLFWGASHTKRILFSCNQEQIRKLRIVWVRALVKHPLLMLDLRVQYFMHYLWFADFHGSRVDSNPYGIQIFHPKPERVLVSYLDIFDHNFIQRRFFVLIGSTALLWLIQRSKIAPTIKPALTVALLCSLFYQTLFSILGFSPYWRFGFSGVLVFWLLLYLFIVTYCKSLVFRTITNRGNLDLAAPSL